MLFYGGAFLGGGSVNKPQSDYHLEFMTGNEDFAREIVYVLKLFHIHAGLTERKEEYVVYLKRRRCGNKLFTGHGCSIGIDGI